MIKGHLLLVVNTTGLLNSRQLSSRYHLAGRLVHFLFLKAGAYIDYLDRLDISLCTLGNMCQCCICGRPDDPRTYHLEYRHL